MMKKTTLKIASAAVAALSVFSLSASASAAGTEHSQSFALIDDANLFDDTQYASLCEKLSSVGSQTGWQIAVVTTDYGISSSRMDSYYNDLYDNNREYFEADSALFVIDNASSNRLILTHGTAEMYFTDERLSDMKSALKPSLSSGDMETAVEIFADKNLEYFEEGVVNGHHSNHVEGQSEEELAAQREKREHKLAWTLTHWGWLFALIAIAAGGIFAGVNVGRYKFNGKGGTYNLKENSSMNLVDRQDVFVNKHTTSTVIQSSSSGSGGSSSGGSSHGSSGSF